MLWWIPVDAVGDAVATEGGGAARRNRISEVDDD